MIEVMDLTRENIIATRTHDKLTVDDYKVVQPMVREIVDRGQKIRWYFDIEDFGGWDADAIWEEARSDIRYPHDFEKIAIVGNHKWERLADALTEFTPAEVRYFDSAEREQAKQWISLYQS